VKVPCATQAFIKAHFPHPELLAGVGGTFKTSTSRFAVSVVSAKPVEVSEEAGRVKFHGPIGPEDVWVVKLSPKQ